MNQLVRAAAVAVAIGCGSVGAFTSTAAPRTPTPNTWSLSSTVTADAVVPASPWFTDGGDAASKEKLKAQILQLGAALDRG